MASRLTELFTRKAAAIAKHASTRTTPLYDRRRTRWASMRSNGSRT